MTQISISKFKARCLAAIEQVRRTGRPLTVTRFGKVVAHVVPPRAQPAKDWIGGMQGTAQILGDLVAPLKDDQQGWEALKR